MSIIFQSVAKATSFLCIDTYFEQVFKIESIKLFYWDYIIAFSTTDQITEKQLKDQLTSEKRRKNITKKCARK